MRKIGGIPAAMLAVVLPLLAGCETTSGERGKPGVTINKGSFEGAEAKLGNDIKSILAQGGLDTANPGAAPGTAVADAPKVLSTTATDLQTLVAQLDANSGLAEGKPAGTVGAPSAALALAPTPKQTKVPTVETKIVTQTETVQLETIGKPGELVPVTHLEVAAAAAPKPTAPKKARPKAKPAVTAPVVETSYRKPTVKRF